MDVKIAVLPINVPFSVGLMKYSCQGGWNFQIWYYTVSRGLYIFSMESSYFWNNAMNARRAELMIKPLADNLMENEEFVIKGNSPIA